MFQRDDFAYKTDNGRAFIGDSLDLIKDLEDNSVNLAFTSPPFALLRKKEYGVRIYLINDFNCR